jgi:hypothetical protein
MAESEAETGKRLGLDRPSVSGPNVGKCPGGAPYGHGMTLTTVHARGCCQAWDQARAEATAEPESVLPPTPESVEQGAEPDDAYRDPEPESPEADEAEAG